ncbi:hypothetical protein A2276_01580 [candidate division WOR-1 bacterium RIFOXYA12_FULL_43_27]|uniref:Uncharacterized protein n=1 Tax=candidate division WOR-1 bacterium RIFOXYC2_FULL_46_14 TaxID=1802587 RepID=A0A1F4U6Y6_UNCSA|nr:MAG: hypothetical protein A2276_01580 [candidate division WOR-1 bacterium RIFOXYA12_FULL_43_27]OGC19583.1 MAG: hypothetical protein A2292_02750 [candidate division WOR-1 bacterium RIFOXYB2_FULL_46_45]OGC30572.1 MAG: hypothetical protein A2232_02750 [candidate division WOR-1 bacterium RIFOXYA2_FULL_46_56]OGC40639.1 MAG: hypothetical protein A2438_06465 [candidate division WOR-1 bacterium RIFOXYC2_FULL_46_14]
MFYYITKKSLGGNSTGQTGLVFGLSSASFCSSNPIKQIEHHQNTSLLSGVQLGGENARKSS